MQSIEVQITMSSSIDRQVSERRSPFGHGMCDEAIYLRPNFHRYSKSALPITQMSDSPMAAAAIQG
jgi:hypothetical protein